jgi:hypothetical protein
LLWPSVAVALRLPEPSGLSTAEYVVVVLTCRLSSDH